MLFPPNSNIEVLGMPLLEMHAGRAVLVLNIRVNVSLKNQTREELEAKRKAVFMPSLHNTVQEVSRELDNITAKAPKWWAAVRRG